MADDTQLLKSIGLSDQKIVETLKNVQLTSVLKEVINEVQKYKKIELVNGTLVYHLGCKIKSQIKHHIPFVTRYIAEGKLDSTEKLDCALEYLLHHVHDKFDIKELENSCGVGIVVTPEEIEKEVEKCMQKHKQEITEKRYRYNFGLLMGEVKKTLKWADGKAVKSEIDVQLLDLLGPKTEADNAPKTKQPKQKEAKKPQEATEKSSQSVTKKPEEPLSITDVIAKINFHKPGENFTSEGYVVTPNTAKLLKEHLAATGGRVMTRFPPEPNGILHVGHAKAININFGYATVHNGNCYLRYDDTNPEKEEEKFVTGILDMVTWLGYKPYKITYSSDNFQILYEWAVKLIKKGLAYVCHQDVSEMRGFNPIPSPWRDRPIAESLQIFQDMKDGLWNEGEATLRMKLTLEEGKQDPVAYRIKFSQHHRTKDKWCIYPTYDYTHCLCDSIENITHSLCTKEFQSRRSSYYWLCNALDIYCPVQWEYGRLNVNYTVVSKRKIAKLIEKNIVSDWDDPRLFTLTALRRRGFPPKGINNFCAQMGVTGSVMTADPTYIEAAARDTLNTEAPRHMAVLEPLKLIINNFLSDKPVALQVPDFPGEESKGSHSICYDQVIYIDSSDFREEADKNFRRLTPTQSVGLKYAGVVLTVEQIERAADNSIIHMEVYQEPISEKNKPKAFIQWVSQPVVARVRTFERLFQHKNPEDTNEVPNGFLSDVNFKSKTEVFAYIDKSLEKIAKPFSSYQFERMGFFSVDPDSKPGEIVFNRTVTLKETPLKN